MTTSKPQAPAHLTDAMARRWYNARDIYDVGPDSSFSALVKIVDRFAAAVEQLRTAMHNPLKPGAATILRAAIELVDFKTPASEALEHAVSTIDQYGVAIEWALRGAPAEEVEAERERERAEEEDAKKAWAERCSPEKKEHQGQWNTDFWSEHLVHTVRAENSDGQPLPDVAPRSRAQIVELLDRLGRELLPEDVVDGDGQTTLKAARRLTLRRSTGDAFLKRRPPVAERAVSK